MKTALVTGGAGFIGSHMTDQLLHDGYTVVVFDNLITGDKKYLPKKAIFIKGDVRRIHDVESVFDKYRPNVVFHIAGQASTIVSFDNPTYDMNVNLHGTIHVIQSAIAHHTPRFLYASSMTVYGHPNTLPIIESTQCSPISYYGISKYAAERFVHATAERKDLSFPFYATSFRMFNVYGPRQSLTNPYQGVMAIFIGNILRNEPITIFGDGKQARDFIFIDDVVRAWISSIDNKKIYNQVSNLGTGKMININSLVSHLLVAFGKNPNTYPIHYKDARQGDQRFMEADMKQTKKNLSFTPQVSIENGLAQTIAWAKQA